MPASKLSQNLRGLCGISVAKAEKIAERMSMREEDRGLFLALVESQHARSRVARQQAALTLEKLKRDQVDQLGAEKFAAVRDWYHLALLEMTDMVGFRSDASWVASQLGLPNEVVIEAVERLKSLELLRIDEAGNWTQIHKDLELPSGSTSRPVREHHKQLVSKALVALDQLAVEKREFSSQTFSVDRAHLPEIKSLMREFQKKIARLSASGQKNAVYVMSLQLFPISEIES